MIVHDAATAAVTLIDTALLWVQALAAGAAFVLCVVLLALGPLVAPGVKALHPRRGAWRPLSPPHRASRDSRVTGTSPSPAQRRTRPVPSWAHTEPYTYEETA